MDSPEQVASPLPTASRGLRRRRALVQTSLLLLVATAAVALWGNNRRPADPTEVLTLHGTPEHITLPRSTLRIATFNIHGMKGPDGRRDPERTARSLDDLDFVALQEVRAGWADSPVDQATLLGEQLGMASLFAPFERRWWTNSFGTGLLTRIGLTGFQRIPLPGHDPNRFRNLLLVRILHQGRHINILGAHIDNGLHHDAQLQAAIHLFLSLESPAVFMGDLNTNADDPQLQQLRREPGVTACLGEPATNAAAARGVDWIVLRGLRCVRHESRDLGASDHPVVCADVELLNEPTRSLSTAAQSSSVSRD